MYIYIYIFNTVIPWKHLSHILYTIVAAIDLPSCHQWHALGDVVVQLQVRQCHLHHHGGQAWRPQWARWVEPNPWEKPGVLWVKMGGDRKKLKKKKLGIIMKMWWFEMIRNGGVNDFDGASNKNL